MEIGNGTFRKGESGMADWIMHAHKWIVLFVAMIDSGLIVNATARSNQDGFGLNEQSKTRDSVNGEIEVIFLPRVQLSFDSKGDVCGGIGSYPRGWTEADFLSSEAVQKELKLTPVAVQKTKSATAANTSARHQYFNALLSAKMAGGKPSVSDELRTGFAKAEQEILECLSESQRVQLKEIRRYVVLRNFGIVKFCEAFHQELFLATGYHADERLLAAEKALWDEASKQGADSWQSTLDSILEGLIADFDLPELVQFGDAKKLNWKAPFWSEQTLIMVAPENSKILDEISAVFDKQGNEKYSEAMSKTFHFEIGKDGEFQIQYNDNSSVVVIKMEAGLRRHMFDFQRDGTCEIELTREQVASLLVEFEELNQLDSKMSARKATVAEFDEAHLKWLDDIFRETLFPFQRDFITEYELVLLTKRLGLVGDIQVLNKQLQAKAMDFIRRKLDEFEARMLLIEEEMVRKQIDLLEPELRATASRLIADRPKYLRPSLAIMAVNSDHRSSNKPSLADGLKKKWGGIEFTPSDQ